MSFVSNCQSRLHYAACVRSFVQHDIYLFSVIQNCNIKCQWSWMKENRRWSMDRLDACIRSPVEKSICFFPSAINVWMRKIRKRKKHKKYGCIHLHTYNRRSTYASNTVKLSKYQKKTHIIWMSRDYAWSWGVFSSFISLSSRSQWMRFVRLKETTIRLISFSFSFLLICST